MAYTTTRWVLATALCILAACDGGPGAGDASTSDAGALDAGIDAGTTICRVAAECDDGRFCNGAESCAPAEPAADARGCVAGAPPCGGSDLCDEAGAACLDECDVNGDADGDGRRSVACGGDDCDDGDPLRFPGAVELCDVMHRDEDCDPATFGFRDGDRDSFADARCCNVLGDGSLACGSDCDDANPSVHPTAVEVCDGLDNDCDGSIDEGVLRSYWPDADGDGYGDIDGEPTLGCFRAPGTSETMNDCDDTRGSVHPAAAEVCEGTFDENCNGDVDEGCSCTGTESRACSMPGVCAAGTEQCVGGRWSDCTIAPTAETCNGLDDDCNGTVDDGLRVQCFEDGDDDGYAAVGAELGSHCPAPGRASVGGCPSGWTNRAPVSPDLDCDDAESSVRPRATELCNMRDDDCDGDVDEMLTTTCYADADGDGYAAAGAVQSEQCGACGSGTTSRAPTLGNIDCRDNRADTYPGAPELCDRRDNDCSSGGGVESNEDYDDDGHTAAGYFGCSGGPLPRDDCRDSIANAFPGQTAYFTTPICADAGYFGSCTCADGAAGCNWGGGGCVCSATAQFWDYDCNGSVRQQYPSPPRDCATSCATFGSCGGSGFVTTTVCGQPGTLRTCSGSCPSGCGASDRSVTQGCR